MEVSAGFLLGGRVRYGQPVGGYRTGLEPVVLAACVPAVAGQRVLEAGTGAGAGLLCLGARVAGLVGVGIEREPAMAALARENMGDNGAPFGIVTGDVMAPPALLPDLVGFDHVFANPPWHAPGSTRSADGLRDAATHRDAAGLAGWTGALVGLMAPRGTLTLILPAGLLGEAVALLHGVGLGRLGVLALWPRVGVAAKIVVVQAMRGAGPSRLGAGLVLHGAGSGYTAEAEAVLRDGAGLVV